MMANKDTRILIEDKQYDFLYEKSKSNLNISFNRIAFIFFIFFIISFIYSIHLIHQQYTGFSFYQGLLLLIY